MIVFNSPLHYCTACRQYVALDQGQRECAHEHGCPPDQPCPLAHLFSARDTGAVHERAVDAPASVVQTAKKPAPKR